MSARKYVKTACRLIDGWAALGVCILLALSLTAAYGEVVASPTSLTFRSLTQSETIALTSNGAPVPAQDIRSWRFLASGHDYKHMLSFAKKDGALTLTATPSLEVGSYDLAIETAAGAVTVQVFSPLTEQPDFLATKAAECGLTVDGLKRKWGIATELPRATVEITLPPVYYEGQTLELAIDPEPGLSYEWAMNGEPVVVDAGLNRMTYTFKTPGEFYLSYKESRDGKTVAAAAAHTSVVPLPPVPVDVKAGTKLSISAPSGYGKIAWSVDGSPASSEVTLTHLFSAPGQHTIECLATAPNDGPKEGFLRACYSVNVTPRSVK